MPREDRSDPGRRPSPDSAFSLMEFMREYPHDAACLDRLWRTRFAPDGHHARCPRCERLRKFHRTRTRACYTCDTCGLHVHPMKDTIFEKSTTSLHQWFYAMYLMTSTRCGISAKQLERELGVGYKTAHRMMKKIRTELLTDPGDEPLSGGAEIGGTSWGGKSRRPLDRIAAAARHEPGSTVLGTAERGGFVDAAVVR
jgi:transposase